MKAFEKPKVGDVIEVQWDGDEEYYLCTVFKAHGCKTRLVVECHDVHPLVRHRPVDPA